MKRKGQVLNKKHVQLGKYKFSQTIKKLNREKEHLDLVMPGYKEISDFVINLISRRRSDLLECQKVGKSLL